MLSYTLHMHIGHIRIIEYRVHKIEIDRTDLTLTFFLVKNPLQNSGVRPNR